MQSLTETQRFYYFLIGCIGLRLLIAYGAKYVGENNLESLPYLGYIALIPAFGFMYLYLSGARPTGPEAGGEIWWNWARPIHSVFYAMFAYLAITKNPKAWTVLFADVVFGFTIWMFK
jgi:hypothetical protein